MPRKVDLDEWLHSYLNFFKKMLIPDIDKEEGAIDSMPPLAYRHPFVVDRLNMGCLAL